MKTRKHNLNAIALGVALAMGSLSVANADGWPGHPAHALADGVDDITEVETEGLIPNFATAQRTGLALVESSLSLIAAHTEVTNCKATTFGVTVNVANSQPGVARIGDMRNTVNAATALLEATTNVVANGGAKVHVKTFGVNPNLKGTPVINYEGNHQWSPGSAIFVDGAIFRLGATPFRERSIKDYYDYEYGHGRRGSDDDEFQNQTWSFDWGLEAILKSGIPVRKWTELSWFKQKEVDFSRDGKLKVVKETVAPDTEITACKILYIAKGYSDGFDFNYDGIVQIYHPRVPRDPN